MISAAEIYDFKGFSLRKACTFIIIFFAFLGNVLGQDPATQVPSYEHLNGVDIVNLTIGFSGVNTDAIPISIDVDPQNFVYVLTFGDGIQKRNPDGSIVKENFITGLSSPLDFAIDNNGFFYVADYSENTTCSENGKIRIFKPNGSYERVIYTGFYRPLGLDVDNEGNIYVAEYNQDGNGCERTEMSRVSVYNSSGTRIFVNDNVERPYRIAVNSQRKVYLSQEGGGDPAVLVLDSQLNKLGELPNIQSPGSVVVDDFDFIHVVEYAGRVDFGKFINFENLSLGEIQDIAEDIDRGIDANAFSIKIFDPSENYEKLVKEKIQFPVDIAFNNCDRMYVDNAFVDGRNTFFGYVPEKIEFDLEIYKRTPVFDDEPPIIISCPADETYNIAEGETTVTITYTEPVVSDKNNFSLELKSGPASGSSLSAGTYNITYVATDVCGYESECTFKITVNSAEETDESPVFENCPSNISTNNDANECGAIVTFGTPTASDEDGDVPVTQTEGPISGSVFPVGTTTVTFSATDEENNTTECSFTVRVFDAQEPTISCPEKIEETVAFGEDGKVVNYTLPDFNDNCAGASIEQTAGLASGSEFPLGETVNTFVVTDASGKTAVCSFTVTIQEAEDTEDPVISCPENIVKNNDEGECRAIVTFNAPVVSDNSGEDPTVVRTDYTGLNSGDSFPVGTTTISFEAKDKAGNTATCSFTITVSDTEDPVISECPQPRSVTVNSDGAYEVPSYINELEVFDNCTARGEIRITQNPARGTLIYESQNILFTITDETGNVVNCNFRLTLEGDNQTPTAVPDTYSTPQNQTLNIQAPGVLANDSDPDGDGLTATLVNNVTNGSLTLNPNGSFIYEPNTDFIGQDSFTYIARDGQATSGEVTVNISVTAILSLSCPGDYPVFADENCQYLVPDFSEIVNVSPEGASISQSIEPGRTTITNADPFITITATYEGQTQTCKIYLLLKDEVAPTVTCPAGQTITLAEGDTFSLQDYRGQLEITENCETRSIVQDPVAGTEISQDTRVSFLITDLAGNTAECGFELNVITEGSLAISCPADKIENLDENCSFSVPDYTAEAQVSNGGNAVISQTPEAGTQITGDGFEVTLRVEKDEAFDECSFFVSLEDNIAPKAQCIANYQLSLSEGETRSLDPGQLDNGSSDNCGGIEFSLNKTEFTTGDEGENTVIFTVTDAAGNTAVCEAIVEVSVNSDSVNDPPVAIDEEYTTQVNTVLEVSAENGVLVNDMDPENDELTAILETDVEFGDLQLNPDGSFIYTPDTGFVGQDFFTYVANDGEFNSNTIFVSINVVDNTGDFGCNSQVILELGLEGEQRLDITQLYNGNSEGLEIIADMLVFTCEDIGENTVTLTYTGRVEGTCEVTVLVVDGQAPVLNLNDISINLNSGGVATLNFADIDNGSYDNCDPDVLYTLSKKVFSCKELGTNLVQVTAEDSSGNISSDTITVTITDDFDTCEALPIDGSEYIFIYPNPNTGSFKVATPAGVTIHRLEVFDHRGRFIAAKDYDANVTEYAIDLGPLQEAIYVVKIITNVETLRKRFIFKN